MNHTPDHLDNCDNLICFDLVNQTNLKIPRIWIHMIYCQPKKLVEKFPKCCLENCPKSCLEKSPKWYGNCLENLFNISRKLSKKFV